MWCVAPPPRRTALDPYRDYLRQRWEQGERRANMLHQELIAPRGSMSAGDELVEPAGRLGSVALVEHRGELTYTAGTHLVRYPDRLPEEIITLYPMSGRPDS